MAGVGVGQNACLGIENTEPHRHKHVRFIVFRKSGVGFRKNVRWSIAGRCDGADGGFGGHHEHGGGNALSRDIRDEKRDVVVVEKEEIIEVAADLLGGFHLGEDVEFQYVRIWRKDAWEGGGLNGFGYLHLLVHAILSLFDERFQLFVGFRRAEKQAAEKGQEEEQDDGEEGDEQREIPMVFVLRNDGDEAVSRENGGTAEATYIAGENLLEGGVFIVRNRLDIETEIGKRQSDAILRLGDDGVRFGVGENVVSFVPDSPTLCQCTEDDGKATLEMLFFVSDLNETAAAFKSNAAVFEAFVRFGNRWAKLLRVN